MVKALRLRSDGSRREIPLAEALPTAAAGAVVRLEGALFETGFHSRLVDTYLDAISTSTSPAVAEELRRRGLERLHDLVDATTLIEILDRLDRLGSGLALPLSRALVETTTGDPPHYFIGSEIRIRAMIPYHLLDDDDLRPRRMQGRLTPLGPHRDTNATLPIGGLSLWCAVTRVLPGNSFVIYDDDADGPGVTPIVDAGDVVVFGTERLHASVPNDTDETRVAVTTRVVLGRRLKFGPGVRWTPYADAGLAGTRLDRIATLQSRLSKAALLRWRHNRRRRRRLRNLGQEDRAR